MGAARRLIQWRIEEAEKKGAPAYLEAGVMARPIHEKMGFRQVGELMELDLRPYSVRATFVMARMAYMTSHGDECSKTNAVSISNVVLSGVEN